MRALTDFAMDELGVFLHCEGIAGLHFPDVLLFTVVLANNVIVI